MWGHNEWAAASPSKCKTDDSAAELESILWRHRAGQELVQLFLNLEALLESAGPGAEAVVLPEGYRGGGMQVARTGEVRALSGAAAAAAMLLLGGSRRMVLAAVR